MCIYGPLKIRAMIVRTMTLTMKTVKRAIITSRVEAEMRHSTRPNSPPNAAMIPRGMMIPATQAGMVSGNNCREIAGLSPIWLSRRTRVGKMTSVTRAV